MSRKLALLLSALLLLFFSFAAVFPLLSAGAAPALRAERHAEQALLLSGGDGERVALELLPGEKLDLNTASAEELQKLPGIGPVLSEAIVAYRTEHGPFTRIEELRNVPGIGQGRYDAVADSVTIGETP